MSVNEHKVYPHKICPDKNRIRLRVNGAYKPCLQALLAIFASYIETRLDSKTGNSLLT